MKTKKEKSPIKAEEVLAQDVPFGLTVKQLIGLSVANISDELLGHLVSKVKEANEKKEQAYKVLTEARLANLDYELRKQLLNDVEESEVEFDVACYTFTLCVLGQVFTWLEGAGK